MHARVVTARVQPGKADEVLGLLREALMPSLEQEPGVRGVLVLSDRDADTGVTIALYESEAALRSSEAGFQERLDRVAPLLAMRPTVETYEVSVQV